MENLNKILEHSEFFNLLAEECNDKQCSLLLEKMETVELQPGETLYKEGDPSDSLYILAQGLLSREIQLEDRAKFLGVIRCGQTVGEMGVIAGQPRSTTIRALRHCFLLKLTKAEFDTYFINQPKVLLKLLNILVAKSTSTIHALENLYRYINIAFIPANEQINYDDFFQRFYQLLGNKKKIKYFDTNDFQKVDANIVPMLEEAERNYDYVIYKINPANVEIANFFLTWSERVFIVADGTKPASLSHFVTKLRGNLVKRELVLLYPQRIEPEHTNTWLNTLAFFRFHHVALNVEDDIARLARIVGGNALALVLSGGGTKGWVHAGVIKALEDAQIEIDVIGGTSVGAVIGAKYLMENNYDRFAEGMIDYARTNEHPYRLWNFTFPLVSILNGKKLLTATKNLFGKRTIESLWKPYFCVVCNLNETLQETRFSGSLCSWIHASTAIPGIFPPVTIKGKVYVDGAIANSLPVDTMREYLDGKGNIVAVDLSYYKDNNEYDFPSAITFFKAVILKIKTLYKKFKIIPIHDIIMRARLVAAAEKNQRNSVEADILIKPDLSSYKLLTEIKHTNELFNMGYQAMQEQLDALKKLMDKN